MTKAQADIRSLARSHTALAIRTLTSICASRTAPAAARVAAASALLDRGWGRPTQVHAGDGDGGRLQIIIRGIGEEEPLVIEHEPLR